MSKAIVLVADRDDAKHGEITVVDDLRKAERLVETLLEAGFDRERIQVFVGNSLGMQVAQRAVVSLVGDGVSAEGEGADPATDTGEVESGQRTAVADPEPAEVQAEAEESDPDAAYSRGGVRFSSLFKST